MASRSFAELYHVIQSYITSTVHQQVQEYMVQSQYRSFSYSFLASGDSYHTLAGCFRTAVWTISVIITWVCQAIWDCLWEKYLPVPTQHDWKRIKTGFRLYWDFPNCVGAIDGKHIAIRSPPNSNSLYYNYKNHFSIVLMAAVDEG